jgi:hypothetical protein
MRSEMTSKLAGSAGRPGRRAQLLLAVAAVALVAGAARAQLPNWRLRVRQTAQQSLTMLTPSSPDFASVLSGVFPGVWGEAGFARVRPYLVILRNDTPLPAVAYALVWTVRSRGGYVGHPRRFFVNTAFVPRIEETVIAPGALRLVSSVASVAPDGPLPGLFSPSNYPPRAQATVIGVSLDGVVFSDGSFIGPNTTHLLQRYVAARFAARDAALSVLRWAREDDGMAPVVSAVALKQRLMEQMRFLGAATQPTLLARYARARARMDMRFRNMLARGGFKKFEAALQRFADGHPGRPSAFDWRLRDVGPHDPRVFGVAPWHFARPAAPGPAH